MMTPAVEGLVDGRPALLASRGTAALMAAAHGLGLAGRDILVPVNLCPIAVAGLIWAGVRPVFHDVDPDSGNVVGWIDLTGLLPPAQRGTTSADAVLNGIAYEPKQHKLYVTGKLWPKLFEVKIVEKRR